MRIDGRRGARQPPARGSRANARIQDVVDERLISPIRSHRSPPSARPTAMATSMTLQVVRARAADDELALEGTAGGPWASGSSARPEDSGRSTIQCPLASSAAGGALEDHFDHHARRRRAPDRSRSLPSESFPRRAPRQPPCCPDREDGPSVARARAGCRVGEARSTARPGHKAPRSGWPRSASPAGCAVASPPDNDVVAPRPSVRYPTPTSVEKVKPLADLAEHPISDESLPLGHLHRPRTPRLPRRSGD